MIKSRLCFFTLGIVYRTKKFLTSISGVTAVEFAMIAPILLVFCFSMFNFGIYYYYTSIIENSAFVLSRFVVDPIKRPANLAAATELFNSAMGRYATSELGDGQAVMVSVNSVTASGPTVSATSVGSYNIIPGAPILIRVVYPRPVLPTAQFLIDAWPKLFGSSVDISILVDPR